MEPGNSLPHSQEPSTHPAQVRGFVTWLRNMSDFYGELLLTTYPTPKLEDHPLPQLQKNNSALAQTALPHTSKALKRLTHISSQYVSLYLPQ